MATLFHCPSCKSQMQLNVLAKKPKTDEFTQRHQRDGEGSEWVFGVCPQCDRPAVLSQSWHPHTPEVDVSQTYPPAVDMWLNYTIPPLASVSYVEAVRCFQANAWLATAVMVRRTLEAVTKEFGATKSMSLDKGLKRMQAAGVITADFVEWSHELRFLGNVGAHPTKLVVSESDATDAMDFLRSILSLLYEMRPRFEKLKVRKAANAVEAREAQQAASAEVPTDLSEPTGMKEL